MTKKIDITAIPELETSVGIHGSMKQQDVANPILCAVVVGVIMLIS